jgi:hypothetical protein
VEDLGAPRRLVDGARRLRPNLLAGVVAIAAIQPSPPGSATIITILGYLVVEWVLNFCTPRRGGFHLLVRGHHLF